MEVLASPFVMLGVWLLFGLGLVGVYLDSRGRQRLVTALIGKSQREVLARVAGQDQALALITRNVGRDIERTYMPPIPRAEPSPPSRASAPVLPIPRMRVQIQAGIFPSERIVTFGDREGKAYRLRVDARDVDERHGQGTVCVVPHVLDGQSVLVSLPILTSRVQGPEMWVASSLVLDPGDPRPPLDTAPDSPAADRHALSPEPAVLSAPPPPMSAPEPREVIVARVEAELDARQREREQGLATVVGALAGQPAAPALPDVSSSDDERPSDPNGTKTRVMPRPRLPFRSLEALQRDAEEAGTIERPNSAAALSLRAAVSAELAKVPPETPRPNIARAAAAGPPRRTKTLLSWGQPPRDPRAEPDDPPPASPPKSAA